MIATRRATARALVSVAQQIGVSVLATLAATAVLTTVRTWQPWHASVSPAAVATPDLTRGGKYAARAAADDDVNQLVTIMDLPPVVPLFTAPAVPALDLPPAVPDLAAEPTPGKPAAIVAPARGPVRLDARRAGPKIPLPPRPERGAGVIRMAALPPPPAAAPDPTFWSGTRAVYGEVAGWSGTMIGHLLP